MKNLILIFFLLFLYSCGYTSVYKNLNSQDLKISIRKMQGDREMNNLIRNEINLYSNKDSTNVFEIEIITEFKKLVLTKDAAGNETDYELSANSVFTIYSSKAQTQKVSFSEVINIKNQTETFEQDIYEKNIKRNFASSIREKLMLKISSTKINVSEN